MATTSSSSLLHKALSHPLVHRQSEVLLGKLASAGAVAIYDPHNHLEVVHPLLGVEKLQVSNVYVRQIEEVGKTILEHTMQPVDALMVENAKNLLVTAFDSTMLEAQITPLLPNEVQVSSLDNARLPPAFLSISAKYLHPLNFVTHFAFFRDSDDIHTRISLVNYWSACGALSPALWLCLFVEDGTRLVEWKLPLGHANQLTVIDSQEIRKQFHLPPFTGSLFMHVLGAAGPDVMKYGIDIYDDNGVISAMHDINASPAACYAGLPAPEEGEKVVLWVQNNYPVAIPANRLALRVMGSEETRSLPEAIPPFATYGWDISHSFPEVRWPAQLEVMAHGHFSTPRYEVIQANGRRHISHTTIERNNLEGDGMLPYRQEQLGKGYILVFPLLPHTMFSTILLPTPMATSQQSLPLELSIYDREGCLVFNRFLGNLPRHHQDAIQLDAIIAEEHLALACGYGHAEFAYNFMEGGMGDGWFHALARYHLRKSGQRAETNTGSTIYNIPLTYKEELHSFHHTLPGLVTHLFLRIHEVEESFCHLIYPCSKYWHPFSSTLLLLYNGQGKEIGRKMVSVPINGSLVWYYKEMFSEEERQLVGKYGYIIIRDSTCRLVGFHGQMNRSGSFSLDHLLGF